MALTKRLNYLQKCFRMLNLFKRKSLLVSVTMIIYPLNRHFLKANFFLQVAISMKFPTTLKNIALELKTLSKRLKWVQLKF